MEQCAPLLHLLLCVERRSMDIVIDLLKAGLTVAFAGFVLLAIATLFIVVFRFAAEWDDRIIRR